MAAVWTALGGAMRIYGIGPVLHGVDICLAVISWVAFLYICAIVAGRPRGRTAVTADGAALAAALAVSIFNTLDGALPTADGWPRAWTGVVALAGWIFLIAWANFIVRDAPRLSVDFLKRLSIAVPLAMLVTIFTLAAPAQLGVLVANVGITHGTKATTGGDGAGTGDTGNGNPKGSQTKGGGNGGGQGGGNGGGQGGGNGGGQGGGNGGGQGGGNGGGQGGGNGGGQGGGGDEEYSGCGDPYSPGASSQDPDLRSAFHDLIESNYGPGDRIAGCLTEVSHLTELPQVEYAFGIDSSNDRASLAVVSPTTSAFFVAPAIEVALRLMHKFGAITTSGAQCAGNGSFVLIYSIQGSIGLVRATIDADFLELPSPVLYAWIASMVEHARRWSWPLASATDVPGIEKYELLHDVITKSKIDTVYYDTHAQYAWRLVAGRKITYYNVLGKEVSPRMLEGLAPHNRACPGLVPNSNRPIVP